MKDHTKRPRAHPRPIASDLAPVIDLDWNQPDEYGLHEGQRVTMRVTSRTLTPLERRRLQKTGKLPKDVRMVPPPWPSIYGTPDPEYEGGWGLRHPDGKTGHAHGDGISLWVHAGECQLCDTQDFETVARIVREGLERVRFMPYCLDLFTVEDEAAVPCGWCNDEARWCQCECHDPSGKKKWSEKRQRHTCEWDGDEEDSEAGPASDPDQ